MYNTFFVDLESPSSSVGCIIMDRQQIGVKLTIDALKLPFQIDGFQDRLIMQKAIYLAQAAGVNLGYYYHWYLYGPYSSSLTRDEFAIAADIASEMDESKGWKLDERSLRRLEEIQSIFAETEREKLARKLELLASVHFLIDRKQVSKGDASRITATLERFKPDFNEEDVKKALEELQAYGFLAA
jgi:uncharacterized protein YwgA